MRVPGLWPGSGLQHHQVLQGVGGTELRAAGKRRRNFTLSKSFLSSTCGEKSKTEIVGRFRTFRKRSTRRSGSSCCAWFELETIVLRPDQNWVTYPRHMSVQNGCVWRSSTNWANLVPLCRTKRTKEHWLLWQSGDVDWPSKVLCALDPQEPKTAHVLIRSTGKAYLCRVDQFLVLADL